MDLQKLDNILLSDGYYKPNDSCSHYVRQSLAQISGISMIRSIFSISCISFALTLLCIADFPVQAQSAQSDETIQDPVTTDINAGLTLLYTGEIDQALEALRPYLSRDSQVLNLLFDAGLLLLNSAQRELEAAPEESRVLLEASIKIFREILVDHPNFIRARLELGRAFFLRGSDGLARRQFNRALAADLPAPVEANINRFMSIMRARKRWSGYFGFALAPNTNIGANSASDVVYVDTFGRRLPFILNDGGETSGVGVSVWTGGEYQLPVSPSVKFKFGGDVFRRDYPRRRFDRMRIGAYTGPLWLINPRTDISLLLTTDRNWEQRDKPVNRSTGFRLETSRRFTPRLTGQLRINRRNIKYFGGDSLNGPELDVTANFFMAITPTLQGTLRTGWEESKPRTIRSRNRTRWLSLGASRSLPRGFNLSGALTYRQTHFQGPGRSPANVLDGSNRRDTTRSLRVSVYKRDLTIRGFSPQLSVTYERRRSNAQQADFKRTGAELSFVRQF